jgi:hypothetical protein
MTKRRTGRPPIGERAMTGAERNRKWLSTKLARAVRLAPRPAPAADGLVLKVEHIRLNPAQPAAWLAAKLDHDVAVAFHDALGRALGAAH